MAPVALAGARAQVEELARSRVDETDVSDIARGVRVESASEMVLEQGKMNRSTRASRFEGPEYRGGWLGGAVKYKRLGIIRVRRVCCLLLISALM